MDKLQESQVEWVVNSSAELGVKIGNQFFFLYKGESLVYSSPADEHSSGPMMWRPVRKREFGECCYPVNLTDPYQIGSVSLDDSDFWKELPAAESSPAFDEAAERSAARAAYALDGNGYSWGDFANGWLACARLKAGVTGHE